jgi:hypothetical protein
MVTKEKEMNWMLRRFKDNSSLMAMSVVVIRVTVQHQKKFPGKISVT